MITSIGEVCDMKLCYGLKKNKNENTDKLHSMNQSSSEKCLAWFIF